jgi:hypothetical protein
MRPILVTSLTCHTRELLHCRLWRQNVLLVTLTGICILHTSDLCKRTAALLLQSTSRLKVQEGLSGAAEAPEYHGHVLQAVSA